MHTVLVIAGGVGLLGLFLLFGHLWDVPLRVSALAFLPAWLIVALVNMGVGVLRAGYPVRDEAFMLLVVLALPVALVLAVVWRTTGAR